MYVLLCTLSRRLRSVLERCLRACRPLTGHSADDLPPHNEQPPQRYAVYLRYSAADPVARPVSMQFDRRALQELKESASWAFTHPLMIQPSRPRRLRRRNSLQLAEYLALRKAGRSSKPAKSDPRCQVCTRTLWPLAADDAELLRPDRADAQIRLKRELKLLTRASRRRGRLVWSDRFFAAVSELHTAGLSAGEIATLLNSRPSDLS